MDNTRIDFEKRREEVNEYFKFLEILNYENVSLKYKIIDNIEEIQISPKLQRIFIANTFLLLYNLVESTVRNSIMEIYNKIQDDEISYKYLSDKIKQIWLEKKRKTFTFKEDGDESLQKSIEKKLQNIIEEIINIEIIVFTSEDIHISGNIDAKEIRKLAKKIGFEESVDGRYLEKIKDKRNRLAHGEQTFHDIGKDFTYSELNNFKENTFNYLENVIEKIKDYIDNKKYKIQEEN
jgi:hypothetical protein